MSIKVAPSILSANFSNLEKVIHIINQSQADWIHLDIMDGVFVPNISFGIPVCQAIQKLAQKPLDVHLMIQHPEDYLAAFKNAGAAIITVHYEACIHLHRTIQNIKNLGCKAGVALNPHTPIDVLKDSIRDIDVVCVMSVNPGFGGQKFIEHTITKIKELKNLIHQTQSQAIIEVDGGLHDKNIQEVIRSGADVLVVGNFLFQSVDLGAEIKKMKAIQ